MALLVKILSSDDGSKRNNRVWCYFTNESATKRTFCEGEAFGVGDSSCEFKLKEVQKGGITCPKCIAKIKTIQAIKL